MKKAIQAGAWAAAITLLALTALPCPADDTAVLRNGFAIRHERRQVIGTITRLYVDGSESSFVDVPTAEIDHFETLPPEPKVVEPASHRELQARAAKALQPVDLDEVVKAASGTYSLDPDLVNSVIRAESGFNVRAVSPKGAQGLMQLMPQTARELNVTNPFDPQQNVDAGVRHLKHLMESYGGDVSLTLAAYNAGAGAVARSASILPIRTTPKISAAASTVAETVAVTRRLRRIVAAS